jgi:hypothetical protein
MSYLEKVLNLAREVIDPDRPGIHHVNVFHDDYCQVFTGGECNCNPDVQMTKPPAWFTAGNN